MSEWDGAELRLYDPNGVLHSTTTDIIEATGASAWHEIGGEQSVVIPWLSNADFGRYANDWHVYVTVINTFANTTHVICDFIIEGCAVEERPLDSGEGNIKVLRITGRNRIKELSEAPVKKRHISKYRQPSFNPTSITETTLQMHATDAATFASQSMIGWTIELQNGDWSEVVGHTAGGLITIDPAWQTNDEDETAPPPAIQKYWFYGAALTETTGDYTDLKQAFAAQPSKGGWALHTQSYQSTATGSFLATNDFSILKTLQNIAA